MMERIASSLKVAAVALFVAALGLTTPASPAETSSVTVDAIVVEPASPAPSTLCKLKVRLKNRGTQAASYFTFSVTIDGQDVPTYKAHSYAIDVDAGATGDLDLNSFWSPATAKPFDIKVALTEAQTVRVTKDGNVVTTSPVAPLVGLPVSATLSVKMSPAK